MTKGAKLATIFPYCEESLDQEHGSAIDSLNKGMTELSRTPCVGEHIAIRSALFEVTRVIHRNLADEGFDASVQLKPLYG